MLQNKVRARIDKNKNLSKPNIKNKNLSKPNIKNEGIQITNLNEEICEI